MTIEPIVYVPDAVSPRHVENVKSQTAVQCCRQLGFRVVSGDAYGGRMGRAHFPSAEFELR